jgi:hypothetical protein
MDRIIFKQLIFNSFSLEQIGSVKAPTTVWVKKKAGK